MSAYMPHHWWAVGSVLLLLAFEVVAGFILSRHFPRDRAGRVLAWLMTIAMTAATERITTAEPAGVRMVAIVLALLYGMKSVVGVESGACLPLGRWLGFCLLWFGMRPGLFLRAGSEARRDAGGPIVKGVVHFAIGFALLVAARLIGESREVLATEPARWTATPPLLAGLSLMLHFGLFNVLAGLWRLQGVDCRPLFRAPALSTSLNEFWSKRWNLAFSEMTALAILRPVSDAVGRRAALVLAFLVSGAMHEVAISVPVKAGYGGPTLYFLLHGLLVSVENWFERRGRSVKSRLWVIVTLLLPLPILFHRPFLSGVVWPIVGIE